MRWWSPWGAPPAGTGRWCTVAQAPAPSASLPSSTSPFPNPLCPAPGQGRLQLLLLAAQLGPQLLPTLLLLGHLLLQLRALPVQPPLQLLQLLAALLLLP